MGHPEFVFNPADQNIQNWHGVAKVKVLAPAGLFHFVLPVMTNNKLVFPLCLECVHEQLQQPLLERTWVCTHTEKERAFTGTWSTVELQKAESLGYQILKIYEVWHFKECR